MSDEEVQQTILRAVRGRAEDRKSLITIERHLGEVGRQMSDAGVALTSLAAQTGKFSEEVVLRKLREIPDISRIQSLVEERGEVARRIDSATEYLKGMGLD